MPRYYFSIENGSPVRGEYGEDLADDKMAHAVAERSAHELARNDHGHKCRRVVARDADGKIICEVPIAS